MNSMLPTLESNPELQVQDSPQSRIANRESKITPLTVRDTGHNPIGEVCLANESRFNSAFFSEPLTAYATGWRDPHNIESLLDFVAPPIQVGRRFEFKKADNSEDFLSETDDARALGAEFKRVEYKGGTAIGKTINRGLTVRIDLDTVAETPNWRETYTTRLLQRLLRNELRRSVQALSDAATGTSKTWDTTAGKDPDSDILAEMIAAADASGLRPNRILFNDVAWNKRLLAHRAQSSAGGYASAGLTLDELAGFFGIDGIRISRDRYQVTTTGKAPVVADIVLLFFGLNETTVDDPTHAKRFWSPCEDGTKYRVYEQQVSSKNVDLTVEHYSNTIVTSTVGIRKITV